MLQDLERKWFPNGVWGPPEKQEEAELAGCAQKQWRDTEQSCRDCKAGLYLKCVVGYVYISLYM